ncbi:sugar nucleotidyltransferase [Halorientalis marina]|uniref:sugar nucleotidyltransferase n=1 Tax=Halorientalis marina TaxID=2931976 RepID=UPI001FF6C734|nr:sugar phosphate nucleotidyltransferase [Halorientalis marina]
MKAVIPAAGQGTRLYPQTHTKPKPMVRVAGKPILGHILDGFVRSPVDEVVIVVGVMKEMVTEYVTDQYGHRMEVSFVEQEQTEGLGHGIYQAHTVVDEGPICIALGDMLFDSDYGEFLAAHDDLGDVDGSIGVKTVDEPSNYGIITIADGRIAELEEKPTDPTSDLAISGFYVIEDANWLFDAIKHLIDNDIRGAGDEYQLTDALQRMLEQGAEFGTFDVGDWYDCGRPETLLEANQVLLKHRSDSDDQADAATDSSVVIQPADIGEDVTLSASVVGPYVSIDDGATVEESHLTNVIVGRNATVTQANLKNSIIGDSATVKGTPHELNVGDSSELQL